MNLPSLVVLGHGATTLAIFQAMLLQVNLSFSENEEANVNISLTTVVLSAELLEEKIGPIVVGYADEEDVDDADEDQENEDDLDEDEEDEDDEELDEEGLDYEWEEVEDEDEEDEEDDEEDE